MADDPDSAPRTAKSRKASRTPSTGAIRVETQFDSDELSNFAVPVEIRGDDLSVVAHTRSGNTVEGLERGHKYFVTGQLPGGSAMTREVTIPRRSTAPITVVLEPEQSGASAPYVNEVQQFFGNPAATILPPADAGQRPRWTSPTAAIVESPPVAVAGADGAPGAALESLGPDNATAAVLESLGPAGAVAPAAAPPATADDGDAAIDVLLGDYLGLPQAPLSPPTETPGAAEPPASERTHRPKVSEFTSTGDEIQVRLFHGNPLEFDATPQDVGGVVVREFNRTVRQLAIPASAEGPWYLQVLQAGHPAVNVALPISPSVGCEVTLSRVPGGTAVGRQLDAISLDVHMANVDANAMARYRSLGLASEAAMGVGPGTHSLDADQLIGGDAQDPIAAAVGCYALLRFNRLEQLDETSENLRTAATWLPDGAAIRGEHLARLGRHTEALEAFLEVAGRGLPVFNEGLSFTMERLDLYLRARESELTPAQVERVRALLPLLQRYCAVTDFTKQLLRFHGLTPNTPGSEPASALISDPPDPTRLDLAFDDQAAPPTTVESTVAPDRPPSGPTSPGPTAPSPYSDPVIAATEARFEARAQHRAGIERKIAAANAETGSILDIDDPQRVALRTQRALNQPIVREALGADSAMETLDVPDGGARLLERILIGGNLLGVAFLELGTSVSHSVGLIRFRSQFENLGHGTGFMVSPRLLLTTNRVLPDPESARSARVEFDFQNGIDGLPTPSHLFDLEPDVLFLTDTELDFTLVSVSTRSCAEPPRPPVPLGRFGFNRTSRDQGKIVLGESINIVQHPSGRPKQIALQQNQLVDRLDHFLHYSSDTSPVSPGAPLFNNQWEVVGLHHSGVPARDDEGNILSVGGTPWTSDHGDSEIRCVANEGLRISSVLNRISKVEGLSPDQQSLVGDVLNPPVALTLPPVETPPQAPVSATPPVSAAVAAEATPAPGGVSLTIPLHITVRLGDVGGGDPNG
ncbi:trypsin-like peptidase domain-containing protein [Rhodococcus daqingensis]|uniref:Serine protease n=1 Tax=Rhodococcus daqingensis TaxID=2479363 RepID=A0ABW2RS82_9NOCA